MPPEVVGEQGQRTKRGASIDVDTTAKRRKEASAGQIMPRLTMAQSESDTDSLEDLVPLWDDSQHDMFCDCIQCFVDWLRSHRKQASVLAQK